MDFRGPRLETDGNVCQRGPAPIETFTRSQLPAISWISMDFHDFHRFSEDVMRFYGFQGSEVWKRSDVCRRGPAPIETFTRSQLPAISWISMDFHDFHRFSEDVMRFHGFLWIFMSFIGFQKMS